MPIYKQTTEITNIDDLLSSVERDIEEVYFGDKNVFTVWAEYDGSLPAQYSAKGSALEDYRIYGAAGGVGDDSGTVYGYEVDMSVRSANLLDTTTMMVGKWIEPNGIISSNNLGAVSQQIAIVPSKNYIYYYSGLQPYNMRINEYDINGEVLRTLNKDRTYKIAFTASPNAAYIVVGVSKINTITQEDVESYNLEICESSTALPYQPYSKTVTPIYIGSSPLNAYEYIDYASGKIYRWSDNQLSVPEVREKTNEEVTCTVSNDGVYTLTVSDTVQSDRILSFPYNPVETPDGKTWIVAAFAENILSNNGMVTLGDAIHPVASAYIRNNGYNVNIAANPSATTYILDRMAITVRAGTPAGTFTLRPMLMYIEPTDPPVPLPALPTVDGTTITDYAGQSAAVPSRFVAKYRKEGF